MKTFALGAIVSLLAFASGTAAHAQMMYGDGYGPSMMGYEATTSVATTTDRGDALGATLWQKLSSGQIACGSLSQSDFASLGDYFMGKMMGSYHEQADTAMTQRLGEQGDEAAHIAMGERFSGCNSSASYPQGMYGFGPMMGAGTMGGWGTDFGGYPMSGFGSGMYGYGAFGGILMALLWLFAIIGVVAIGMWIVRRTRIK